MQRSGIEALELLEQVDMGEAERSVTLRSGRRYELGSEGAYDRLTVRSRSGVVLLRVCVGEEGPVLMFESAEIALRARRKLSLSASTIELETDGDLVERVGGNHHVRVKGEERVEAAAIALQANEGDARVQAMGKVGLDGEQIGLNDQLCPLPFPWSALMEDRDG